ncbi:hypothetical protein CK222_24090 [Mesorhizobium sp. WSM3866]|uniref:hypothetical protein n=1 Tax=Mesorhizobium sp. WSM3866 TaxID=422271 RepID=UPI000BAE6EF2|nr:hypothetical protein [Mesorhizobium sp. WSM3866]PBB41223.1 hypothetical protein CK222_24090 [Mesorhizobium sp. WSM3866]
MPQTRVSDAAGRNALTFAEITALDRIDIPNATVPPMALGNRKRDQMGDASARVLWNTSAFQPRAHEPSFSNATERPSTGKLVTTFQSIGFATLQRILFDGVEGSANLWTVVLLLAHRRQGVDGGELHGTAYRWG